MTNNNPLPPAEDQAHLAVVVPMPTGRLLDVPSIVDEVFDAWRRSRGVKGGKVILTPKRRRAIEARVKEGYTREDLLAAVVGWKRSAFHCGANEHRRVYNELTLILRDGEHVEQFRDYEEGANQADPSAALAFDPAVAAVQRQREREGRA